MAFFGFIKKAKVTTAHTEPESALKPKRTQNVVPAEKPKTQIVCPAHLLN